MSFRTAPLLSLVDSIPDIKMDPLKYVFETLALSQTPDGALWLEFGVWSGRTINYIAQHASGQVYGFDSFEGLPETWRPGFEKGTFYRGGALPTVRSNVQLVKGWFSDTLPGFLRERPGQQVAFLHLDADLYSSTIFVLEALKDRLDGCVVVFDELVNYDGFDGATGELRAWQEFVSKYEVDYEWIGMNGRVGAGGEQAALRIRSVCEKKKIKAAAQSTHATQRQRLLIYVPHMQVRAAHLTYANLWNQVGFSGTETALMEIGKMLVDSGRFEVTVVDYAGDAEYVDPASGIWFRSLAAIGGDAGVNDYDWYCPLFFTWMGQHHQFMRQIRDRTKTKLLLWLQCILGNDEFIHQWRQDGFQVYGLAVSQWVYDKYIDKYLDEEHLWLVPNGVSPRFFQEGEVYDNEERRGAWCFHAWFVRGGSVAARVFERVRHVLPNSARSFHVMSYHTKDGEAAIAAALPPPAFVQHHGSLSKTEVARRLAVTEYFVYPLVHPHGEMHHDTFGCVILEALAMGVIVVTWNVACNPKLYGDHIVALPPPPQYASDAGWGHVEPWFLSDEAVGQLADAVIALEADPARKAELQRRGMEWARQQTWDIGARTMLDRMATKRKPATTTKQRLLIYHPHMAPLRRVALTYNNLWTKGGFSGTDTAFMEIGKLLVDSGKFEVTLAGYNGDAYSEPMMVDQESGIVFQSAATAEINEYDWYCPLFFLFDDQHRAFMHKIRNKAKTKLLVWLHCFLDDDTALHYWSRQGFQVYGMAVSQWVYDKYLPYLEPGRLWLVPNGVSPRFHQTAAAVPAENNSGGVWCFHQTFSRGGSVALRVFDRVRLQRPGAAKNMHLMSYYTPDGGAAVKNNTSSSPETTQWHGSLSKTRVAEILRTSEYFVYPLAASDGTVKHDTFACVILEALAMGVIVITWNVACIPLLYGDHVVALPPPVGYPANNRFAADPWFLSEEAVDQLAAAVLELDADPGRKAELRSRGMAWARQQTWDLGADVMIANMVPLDNQEEEDDDYDFIEIGTSHFDTLLQDSAAAAANSATNNATAPRIVRGLSVDPIQYYLDCLPNVAGVTKVRAAVSDRDGSCDVHFIPEAAVDTHGLPWWLKGCNSINGPHLHHIQQGLLDLVQVQTVPMVSCARLFREHHVRRVNFLKIDTEGHDCVILRSLHTYLLPLAAQYRPRKIQFESNGLVPAAEVEQVVALFTGDLDYTVTSRGFDTIMEIQPPQPLQLAVPQPLFRELRTLHPQVTGYLDLARVVNKEEAAATIELVGWAFQLGAPASARQVRFRSATTPNVVLYLEAVRRDDVVAAHNNQQKKPLPFLPAIAWCGWNQTLRGQEWVGGGTLEMKILNADDDWEWVAFMKVAAV